jgi:signal transduction histidine kinase
MAGNDGKALAPKAVEGTADVGALAGGLAHEIRNPLGTLSLNLQLLAEDLSSDESPPARRAAKRLAALRRETQRLNDILEDFLRFARGHKLNLARADLNKVIQSVLDFQSAEALSRNVHIRASYAELPPVLLDADLFRQAFLNVTINAEQAMSNGGELMVRSDRDHGRARIDVIDTGAGIPPENLPRVFDVYFSTKANGTGLGLSTAKRIIEEHGGTIAIHSEIGRGTCVTIQLPLAPET